ncbi:DNA ligase I, ATP-dependent Dnl1 [Halorubrum saccharovorum DSM 1137]|uniref:DNA ligase n=1 Tax=Halorubrum saccharovorum DSM 1137 TaxID=1227484 RepID=M0DPR6_9EURY|nr:ATP-dependent DNA ligase LigA [Halorubrum saccharovorum]ELZ36687.1 DNA ligase I, ATP-dependent Dnl1 [Halorubrum saccharovorum DSM 1137]
MGEAARTTTPRATRTTTPRATRTTTPRATRTTTPRATENHDAEGDENHDAEGDENHDAEGDENHDAEGDGLATVVRFLLGRVFPAHDTRTLDVGPALCREAIARAAGPNVTAADVEARLAEAGEIGAVAAGFEFGGQRGLAAFGEGRDQLSVAAVDAELRELAAAAGDGSESRKRDALFGLFNRCEPAEAKVLARLVLGEMRLGVGEGAVRDAIAEAFLADSEAAAPESESGNGGSTLRAGDEAVAAVERALQVTNDYGHVAVLARDEGLVGLRAEGLAVGRPVQAMLAQAGTATDAVEAFGEVAVETKFDGARVQVHYVPESSVEGEDGTGGNVSDDDSGGDGLGPRIYSRNMDDVTDALPEVVECVEARVSVPVILDGEVVAIDDDGDPLPFQEVLRRFRRKHDVDRMREEVGLRLHAFDCLHADGEDLLDEPLRARHDRLVEVLPDAAAGVEFADDPAAIEAAEAAALAAGHEGVMLKNPESAYTPGDRGRDWLKRKPDVETLDAVVIGAEWGEGRRAELFGTFLLGVRAGDDEFATIGKVATGLTDEELADLTERLEPHVVSEDGTEIAIRPEVVLEVGYEAIQTSPTYSSGYALRFPRFVGVREDKSVHDADSLERVTRLAGDGTE